MTNRRIENGMTVFFHSKVFDPDRPWYPYYQAYKGHKFLVSNVDKDGHISLICITDPNVIVQGRVHEDELKQA